MPFLPDLHLPKMPLRQIAMTGIVLAGGYSRRFGGGDKFLTRFPHSSKTLLQRSADILLQVHGIDRVCISCRQDQARLIGSFLPQCELLTDPPGASVSSPIYGALAALTTLRTAILVIPCDLPMINSDILSMLAKSREAAQQEHADPEFLRHSFIHSDGRVETLIAIYEYACLPFLGAAVASGRYGLYSAIPQHRQKLVPCPDGTFFLNMNSQADFQEISRIMLNAGA